MHTNVKYAIHDLIDEDCITFDDGQKIYDMIHPELLADREVELDFTGVTVLGAPFLNAAIGHLLRDIKSEDFNRLVKVSNLISDATLTLDLVIRHAKEYYALDEASQRAIDEIVYRATEENS